MPPWASIRAVFGSIWGALNLPYDSEFQLEDLLTGYVYTWKNRTNYIALRPNQMPAHIFRIVR